MLRHDVVRVFVSSLVLVFVRYFVMVPYSLPLRPAQSSNSSRHSTGPRVYSLSWIEHRGTGDREEQPADRDNPGWKKQRSDFTKVIVLQQQQFTPRWPVEERQHRGAQAEIATNV